LGYWRLVCPRHQFGLPVLFVRHDVGRNGRDYRDYWLNLVDDAGILAISIEFPEASFPEYLWYHFGNLHDRDGTPNRREEWKRENERQRCSFRCSLSILPSRHLLEG
jgi:hypothetical protein